MMLVSKGITERLKVAYTEYPRLVWAIFLLLGLITVLLQTYFAKPRGIGSVLFDAAFAILVVFTGFILLLWPQIKFLFLFGGFYLFLMGVTYFTSYIPKPYGTFFFLLSTWSFTDWLNYKNSGKCIFSELMDGNYILASGVLLSTFLFGLVTELVNLPFLIWEYNIPMPSLDSFGIPALIAAFGWTPWTLAILSIFYPFTSGGKGEE